MVVGQLTRERLLVRRRKISLDEGAVEALEQRVDVVTLPGRQPVEAKEAVELRQPPVTAGSGGEHGVAVVSDRIVHHELDVAARAEKGLVHAPDEVRREI